MEPRIEYLLRRFMAKTLTPEEQDELLNAIEDTPESEFVTYISASIEELDGGSVSREEWSELISRTISADKPAGRRRSLGIRYISVAAVLILITTITLLYFNWQKAEGPGANSNKIAINPGLNRAVLIMENGQKIELGSTIDSSRRHMLSSSVKSISGGEVVYAEDHNHRVKASGMNILKTPMGGQYRVVLPDGSVVWLNSASELKFPSSFAANAREVELNGEAYFEVSNRSGKVWPFFVNTSHQKVCVLATKFNIAAYDDESQVRTSLLEGKVKVVAGTGGSELLKPGQEASLDKTSNLIKVRAVDVDDVVAWKEGLFVFNNEDVVSAMNKIARWYNVEVIYQGSFRNKAFWGTVSRDGSIEDLLKTLQSTGVAKFKIEGRRVIVMP